MPSLQYMSIYIASLCYNSDNDMISLSLSRSIVLIALARVQYMSQNSFHFPFVLSRFLHIDMSQSTWKAPNFHTTEGSPSICTGTKPRGSEVDPWRGDIMRLIGEVLILSVWMCMVLKMLHTAWGKESRAGTTKKPWKQDLRFSLWGNHKAARLPTSRCRFETQTAGYIRISPQKMCPTMLRKCTKLWYWW